MTCYFTRDYKGVLLTTLRPPSSNSVEKKRLAVGSAMAKYSLRKLLLLYPQHSGRRSPLFSLRILYTSTAIFRKSLQDIGTFHYLPVGYIPHLPEHDLNRPQNAVICYGTSPIIVFLLSFL